MKICKILSCIVVLALAGVTEAATTQLMATATVTASCVAVAPASIPGVPAVKNAPASYLNVSCSSATPYSVGVESSVVINPASGVSATDGNDFITVTY